MAKQEIKVGQQFIGFHHPSFLIAEIGINHNGDMAIVKRLIDASFACGWSCVKFQKRTPDICVPDDQKTVMKETPWGRMTYLEYKKRIELSTESYDYIDKYCKEKPILWSASIWDHPSLVFLLDYDVPFIKIPSALLTNDELLIEAAKRNKPIFMSTGMSTLEEIDHAVELLDSRSNGEYVVLHCNSAYPTPDEEINLNLIPFLRKRYNCIVGYSGHEQDLSPTVVATSYGAAVIERHVTLSHDLWGTDQKSSLEIEGMHTLVKRVKQVQTILGDGVKVVTDSEKKIRRKLREQ